MVGFVFFPLHITFLDVLAWAVNNFSDSLLSYDSGSYKMTVFVRAQVVQLLKCLPLSESLEEHLAVLSEIFERCPILVCTSVVLNLFCRIHPSFLTVSRVLLKSMRLSLKNSGNQKKFFQTFYYLTQLDADLLLKSSNTLVKLCESFNLTYAESLDTYRIKYIIYCIITPVLL